MDASALLYNYGALCSVTGSDICAMVKADGYGHGLCETAAILAGYNGGGNGRRLLFGAATAEEALTLREKGVRNGILVVGGLQREYARELIKNGITCTALSEGDIILLGAEAAALNKNAYAHLKLDTGMHRLGLSGAADINKAFAALSENKNVKLTGIFTHYATGDSNGLYLNYQYDVFSHMLAGIKKLMKKAEFGRLCIHGANTGATLTDKKYHMDMVRIGLFIYGFGSGANGHKVPLKPAMTVTTRIVQISRFSAGEFIGYGNNYRLERDSVIAVIRAGYGDGYKRALSNRGKVSVKGRLCPVVGNVCMDLCMIDVTDVDGIGYGDPVYLLNGQVTAEDLAAVCGTVTYDILTAFSRRANRLIIK